MKIIYARKRNILATFTVIGGLGAFWLTFIWFQTTSHGDMSGNLIWTDSAYINMTHLYYLINSGLLTFAGLFLIVRSYKIHALFSLIVGLSVFASLFVVDGDSNLFMYTTLSGIVFGATYGGFILVPLFLVSTLINFIQSLRYMLNKIQYSNEPKAPAIIHTNA